MRVLWVLFFIFPLFASAQTAPAPDWNYIEKRLKKEKFSSGFIKELKATYETDKFIDVLKLNVLLFLRKTDDHGGQVTDTATEEVEEFMRDHYTVLTKVEKEYRVQATVVASLLWIESRHGRNQGRYHLPSVYLHLLQAERKPVIKYLQANATEFTDNPKPKQIKEIAKRTTRKAKWAVDELRALQKFYRWKWAIWKEIRSSFAGAFGMPQFIPTSYVKWARSANPKVAPDLNQAEDAIRSVAYYLKDHGWKKNMRDTHVDALMKYNNSRDYANAILALSKRVKKVAPAVNEKRVPAEN